MVESDDSVASGSGSNGLCNSRGEERKISHLFGWVRIVTVVHLK